METCPACKMPVLEGQPAYQKKDVGTFHSTCGDPLGIQAAVAAERKRCVAEVRRIQKRNTNTAAVAPVWNAAVETMANECADAIANLES